MRGLSVIVVSYEVRDTLRACLSALERAGARGPGEHEILVVDNDSRDGSAAMVRAEFPFVRVVEMGANRGFSAAVNAGARLASGRALFLLNPDTELPEGGLDHAASLLAARPDVAALGFRQLDDDGRFQLAVGLRPTLASELLRRFVQRRLDRGDRRVAALCDRWLASPRDISWVAGSSLLVRKDAFVRTGGFDEGFFLFFEDIDFCLRLRAAGYRVVYDPSLTLVHHRGQSAARVPGLAERAYRDSQMRFWDKHGNAVSALLVRVYLGLRARELVARPSARHDAGEPR